MGIEASKKRPGGNVDSWCGKCKRILAHTIEAMVGDKPARVHCNTCKAQHTYKPNAPSKVTRQARETENTSGPPRKRVSRYEASLKGKDATLARRYSPQDNYAPGDVVDHPHFGLGVATVLKDPTKIEILFEQGPKVLVHGR